MGLLRWLAEWFRPDPVPASLMTVDDPVFGSVTENGPGDWFKDDLEFQPSIAPVHLSVPGDDSGPSEHARQTYLELIRRFSELKPKLAQRLFEHSDAKFNKEHAVDDATAFLGSL